MRDAAPLTWIVPVGLSAVLTLLLALAARRGPRVLALAISLLVAALLFAVWKFGAGIALESVRCGPRCGHGASLGFLWVGIAVAAISLPLWLRRPARPPARVFVAFTLGLLVLSLTLDVWVA